MTLLTVVSFPSAGPARMQEALVPKSNPTRIRLRSPVLRGVGESAGRSSMAVAARSAGFLSGRVVVVMWAVGFRTGGDWPAGNAGRDARPPAWRRANP